MEKRSVSYCELEGTYFEIGRQMARRADLKCIYAPAPPEFTQKELEEAFSVYEKWCPGILEELKGFSEESGVALRDIAFSWMTLLLPRCCGLVLTGEKTSDGHTKIARSYEFGIEAEDLAVYRTAPTGKYAHVGGSIVGFGRCEGINEKGLAVSMSSCGLPVSNMPGMRPPKLKGLQFWLVIRSLLENSADVKHALDMVMQMPIAYNINLYLADGTGQAVIFETMDGEKAYEQIGPGDVKQYLCGTNHVVLKALAERAPEGMENSIVRYGKLKEFAETKQRMEEAKLRDFLLKKYPEGMTSYYYKDGFGTIKSVIMDTVEKRFSICWLGQKENGWKDYLLDERQTDSTEEMALVTEEGYPEFFSFRPIPLPL